MPEQVNLGARLRRHAETTPDKPAAVLCSGPGKAGAFQTRSITFAELERDSDAAARGLEAIGIGRGVKTLVMIRPSFAFFSCFFALFKTGAVPVLIDPGMGGKRLLECVREAAPSAMIGISLAHIARLVRPRAFPKLAIPVTVGRRWFWGGHSWDGLKYFAEAPYALANTGSDDLAAILFTTGSTGPAKGVEYSHGALDRQIDRLSAVFTIGEDDIDAATFPGFSLFSIALGMTAVVPDIDPVRPGGAYPPNVITPINKLGCTFSFGSPALWARVSRYAAANSLSLPSLRRVVMAGAPAPAEVHERLLGGVLPDGAETFTPYGATEVMPVACIAGSEVMAETAAKTASGAGVCVGRPVEGVRVEIIAITDDQIAAWSPGLLAPEGEIGEIAIRAAHAARRYHHLPDADRLAIIRDGTERWRRMGDVGYKDGKGRLWFCGRKSHRVVAKTGTLFTIPCEAIFNRHPDVARSALVGIPGADGFARPAMLVELCEHVPSRRRARLADELLELARSNPLTAAIRDIAFHPGFPTDIRHNAKIRREDLAVWAARKFGVPRNSR